MDSLPFLHSEYPCASPQKARFWIIPVPLEKTVSYGSGTKDGPLAILRASQQLEAWVEGLSPGQAGFWTAPSLDCSQDLELVLAELEAKVQACLENGSVPVLLGGEHTVTLGALRALAKRSSRQLPGLVQIDAHADLRHTYENNPYSHACVMHRAVADLGYRLVQFATREYSPLEVELRDKYQVIAHDAEELFDHGLPSPILPSDFPKEIYLTFDLDGLDSSLMPATGTPSPGGLFWNDARRLLKAVSKDRRIIGFDVVELAPKPELHSCDYVAAKLTHLLLGLSLMSLEN